MTNPIKIFQIFYNEETRASIDPVFQPLDNSRNERPDWFEYWPIQSFLKQQSFENDTYYGFLSPKFGEKTRLSGAEVLSFVAGSGQADVVTFSPFPDQACFFRNIFEQGEVNHEGLLEVSKAFFVETGLACDPDELVMDARTTVFCNYFVAKGRFWRKWNEVFQQCFSHAENPSSPLHMFLTKQTRHANNGAQMKIFLMERIVSTLLSTTDGLRIRNYAPLGLPPADSRFIPAFANLIAMDALKMAYLRTREPYYLEGFNLFQKLTRQYLSDRLTTVVANRGVTQ